MEKLRRFLQQEEGQTLVEYALILAVVSATIILALSGISGALERAFAAITSTLSGVIS